MRRIIGTVVIVVALLLGSYLAWTFYDVFANATRKRNTNYASVAVHKIYDAEIKAKKDSGSYLTLQDLIDNKAVDLSSSKPEKIGYRFTVDLSEDNFVITAIPTDEKEKTFSMDSNRQVVVR